MEKEQRNAIQRAVKDARNLLEGDFGSQLLEVFDIDVAKARVADGPGSHLDGEQRFLRSKLTAAIAHKQAAGNDLKEALLLFRREMAFTALNRFVALKLMEARVLVHECVSQGLQSSGFEEFTGLAPALLADPEGSYQLFLQCLFEDVSREVKVLFDPRDPASLLWPRRAALLELLEILNRPELAEIWSEDETIGWVYQYFNDEAERKEMRKSSTPRNSRELAVRNQFFTPRYVVEFLTDNTLSRIWYEMRRGETSLRNRCRYLVRRPTEIFLQPGEDAPESAAGHGESDGETLSQEELLRQPAHIPYRPLKDPREILLLDPACGSMHFGLYAFDLFTLIYEEAWDIAQGTDDAAKTTITFAPFVAFSDSFADKAAFLREVPRLIVEHNIHGIDIDARATQIARLSLWLRAQRAWQQIGLAIADRPSITRANVVCAEPMPGEKELLREFVAQEFSPGEQPAFTHLLETIFDQMTLAGEAGSLLRIEEEIRTAIADAKRLWKQGPSYEQSSLFSLLGGTADQAELGLDLSGITDEQFWDRAEQRIYDALQTYAEQAENGGGFKRRLFAGDAAQGFAFIDLCRKRYDAVVMNPPFGESTKKVYEQNYPSSFGTSRQIASLFVSRNLGQLFVGGLLGVLAPRLLMFLDTLEDWRRDLLGTHNLCLTADLGYGVLDAVVEPAAFVLSQDGNTGAFFRLLSAFDKQAALVAAITQQTGNSDVITTFNNWSKIPGHRVAYWAPRKWLDFFDQMPLDAVAKVSKGLESGEDERFLRLHVEVPSFEIDARWRRYPKGGDYQPVAGNDELVVDYSMISFARRSTDSELYGLPGITYTKRTTSFLSFRALSTGAIFSPGGPGIIPNSTNDLIPLLSYLNCRPIGALVELCVGSGDSAVRGSAARDYNTGIIKRLPWLIDRLSAHQTERIRKALDVRLRCIERHQLSVSEISPSFLCIPVGQVDGTLIDSALIAVRSFLADAAQVLEYDFECDKIWRNVFGFLPSDDARLDEDFAKHPLSCTSSRLPDSFWPLLNQAETSNRDNSVTSARLGRQLMKRSHIIHSELENLAIQFDSSPRHLAEDTRLHERLVENGVPYTRSLISYLVGCIFGRWNILCVTRDLRTPVLADPFEPIPRCAPGMLQGHDCTPLSSEAGQQMRAEGVYPLDVAWVGILVDDPEHPLDIEFHIQYALDVLFGDRAEVLAQEARTLLGVQSIRNYFRNGDGFFADHLQRYSKSRRQAPIYWQLSAGNGIYTVWLYYHRFTADTIYRLLQEFVDPRISQAERDCFKWQQQVASGGTTDAAQQLQASQALLDDLKQLKAELSLVAPLWKPDLNDGVIINHAILWRITPHAPWQKKVKECWDKLVDEEYDWAHLAFHLWPERVIPKCATDRSLAIAHGLDDTFWRENRQGKWEPIPLSEEQLAQVVAAHTNHARSDALKRFLAAPPPLAATRARAPRAAQSASAGTSRARRTSQTLDPELIRQVQLVLTAAPPEGLAKTAIAELLATEDVLLTAVIKQLKESGQIEQLGQKRGARYRLSSSGLAAAEAEGGMD